MNRSVSNWINGFARGAIKALDAEYEQRDLITKEQRAKFVSHMLGERDQFHKRRPFLWKTTDEPKWFPDPATENRPNEFQACFSSLSVTLVPLPYGPQDTCRSPRAHINSRCR